MIDKIGLPQKNNKLVRGRLFIVVHVVYPDSLSSETSDHIFELLKYFNVNNVENKTSYNELKIIKYQ